MFFSSSSLSEVLTWLIDFFVILANSEGVFFPLLSSIRTLNLRLLLTTKLTRFQSMRFGIITTLFKLIYRFL